MDYRDNFFTQILFFDQNLFCDINYFGHLVRFVWCVSLHLGVCVCTSVGPCLCVCVHVAGLANAKFHLLAWTEQKKLNRLSRHATFGAGVLFLVLGYIYFIYLRPCMYSSLAKIGCVRTVLQVVQGFQKSFQNRNASWTSNRS